MNDVQEAPVAKLADHKAEELGQLTNQQKKTARYERNRQTLQHFYDKYPNCFIQYHASAKERKQPKPLALGIHRKIHTDNPELPIKHISDALKIYVMGHTYIKTLKAGTVRVDLQGNPSEDTVTEEQEKLAKARLAKQVARIQATQENRSNAAANKKKREEAENQKTKPAINASSKKQTTSASKSANNTQPSQTTAEVKLVDALKGPNTLSLKKKEKPQEKCSPKTKDTSDTT